MGRARSIWTEALADEAAAHVGLPPDRVDETELDPGGDLAHRFLVVDALRARGVAHAVRGDLPRARRLLHEGMHVSREAGMFATEVWLAYAGFVLDAAGFAERLIELTGHVGGPTGELFPRHAAARQADDANELEATALALAEAGFNLYAAGCAGEASRAFRRDGVPSGATRCAALAIQLQDLCEGAESPRLVDLVDVAALTPRERDVTLLAAKGLTNRDIAEATSTSLRTVEGHLLRAYRKLGITSRAELAAYFRTS
jgi:DNA-binding CsgD family transcriptional regulator